MNKMKLYTIIGAGLFALTSTTLLACSEIEDGSNDMSSLAGSEGLCYDFGASLYASYRNGF